MIAFIIISFLLLPNKADAQCALKNSVITPGEELEYTLYFFWGIIWKEAGTATFTTEKANYNNKEALKMNLLVSSSKEADKLFKMRDTITSYVSNNLEPLYFRKAAEEGNRFTIDEARYNYKNDKSFIRQTRTWKDGRIEEFQDESYNCIYDMLSVLSKARSMDTAQFSKGDRFNIEMATGKTVEKLILEYRGVEKVKTNDMKSYKCMVFTLLKEDKNNKLKDFISFYITNDERKLMVKLKFELNFGSAQVTLKKIKNI